MARFNGRRPNAGAIISGAVIFSLVAAGLFFAFWPTPEPTDAGLSSGAATSNRDESADSDAANGESENSLTAILTPLPIATPMASSAVENAAPEAGTSAPNGGVSASAGKSALPGGTENMPPSSASR